jgi:hypothetical protein
MEVPFKALSDPDRNGSTIRAKKWTHPKWEDHLKNQMGAPFKKESGPNSF